MSLVSHISSANSPLNHYFKENFVGLRDFLKADENVIKEAPIIIPQNKLNYPWGEVGHIAEYMFMVGLKLHVGSLYPMRLLVGANSTPAQQLYNRAIQAFKYPINAQSTHFLEQCNVLYSLAHIEGIWRGKSIIDIRNLNVSESMLLDLKNLWEISLRSSSFFKVTDKFIYNPEFSLSRLVGGADADFIKVGTEKSGNTLVDMKLSITPKINSQWIYQLLGYYFLDKLGYYKIKNIEIFLPRQNYLLHWGVEEIILGATNFATVRRAKAEFMNALKQIPASIALEKMVKDLT